MFDTIAIDWGTKRPGIAFGSSTTGLIIPFSKEITTENLIFTVLEEIKNRKIQKIVLGKPLNSRGGETETTKKISEFKKELESKLPKDFKIDFQDERWTSKDGSKIGLSKADLNHFAAIKILERYFQNHL